MPLKQCTNKDGVKGWSWGNGGCIVGKDAKQKAIKQGIAIEGPGKFKKIMEKDNAALLYSPEVRQALAEYKPERTRQGENYVKAVMAGRTLVSSLNEDLANEYESIIAYVVTAQSIKGAEYMNLIDELEKHAADELKHANIIAKQIDYLGGVPTSAPQISPEFKNAEQMLRLNLEGENKAIGNYTERIRQCEQAGKYEVAEQIRQILLEEQDHKIELTTALGEKVKAYITKKERDKVSDEDFGEPKTRKYPVRNQKDLDSAIKLAGRTKTGNPDQIRKRLAQIAKKKGLKLPDSWKDGSGKGEAAQNTPDKVVKPDQEQGNDRKVVLKKLKKKISVVKPTAKNDPTKSKITRTGNKMPANWLQQKPVNRGGA